LAEAEKSLANIKGRQVDNDSSDAAKQIREAMLPNPTTSWVRGIIGAIVGAVIGFLLFKWLLSQNYYAGMLPGGLFGCWADGATNNPAQSLLEYLQDYRRIPGPNKIMIALGAVVSGWFSSKK